MRILTASFLAASTLSGVASAEVFGYDVLGKKVQLVRPELSEQVTNVYNYEREEYRPDGVRAGSFDIYGTAEVDVVFDDNIFATDTNTESDVITKVKPALIAKSDWGRHEVVGKLAADFGRYADNDDENYEDYNASISGRLDVVRNSYAVGSAGYSQQHEERGAPNANTGTTKPTEYDVANIQAGYVHAPGRFSVSGLVDYTDTDFDDNGTVNNDDRDRDRTDYTVQLGYEVTPAYEAFVRGSYIDVDYDANVDDNGFNRDNDGYRVVTGVGMDLSGKVRGEAFVGYVDREFNDAQFSDIDEATYGANVLWNINGLTSLQGRFDRTVEETVENNAAAYVRTGGDVTLEHEFRRNILGSAYVGFSNNDYEGGTSTRDDDYTVAGLEARYLINKCFTAGLAYDYTQRDSNIAGDDYDRNRFMVKLTGSLSE